MNNNNPFLFNNMNQNQPQQQNYQYSQQNQGWNQNFTSSAQPTFHPQTSPPQIDFFDMTTPQNNQTQANMKPLTPNDFRSLMNSTSNSSTSQFSQQVQPPKDLNQLRTIFTRDDEPIIAPITPQSNQQQQFASTYSPSFTFEPETTNQNQNNINQGQSQVKNATIDFSKYDPLAGELINSNIAKQKNQNNPAQNARTVTDIESVPMVFYGADSTAPTNQIQFGNFQPTQPNQNLINSANQANLQQPQQNYFFNGSPQPDQNTLAPQAQQQNPNFVNAQPNQQPPAPNILGTQNQPQNINFFNIQNTPQQSAPQQSTGAILSNQASQQNPNTNFLNTQVSQPPATNIFDNQAQQKNDAITKSQANQQQPTQPTNVFENPAPQQNTNIFNSQPPQSTNTNEAGNPFLSPSQSGSLDSNPFLNNPSDVANQALGSTNSSAGAASIEIKKSESSTPQTINSAPPSLDIFRINDDQQKSDTISNLTLSTENINHSLNDIFGFQVSQTSSQKQSDKSYPFGQSQNNQQESAQKQTEAFHPFGQTQNNQQETVQKQAEAFHPFAQVQNNQQESVQKQTEDFHPFAQAQNNNQKVDQKPTISSDNPFALGDNIFQINSTAPKSEPTFATTDDSYNPFGAPSDDKENPFANSNPAQSPQQQTPSNPQSAFNIPPPKPNAPTTNEDNPFVGIAPTNENPFISNTKSTEKPKVTSQPPANNNNNQVEEPFDPFGRNSKKNAENKKETSKTSEIDLMRSLFASNMDDLFTKNSDQPAATTLSTSSTTTPSPETTTNNINAEQNQQQGSETEPKVETQNNPPAFDPFGVGNALPMAEGASFTFNIDEHEEKAKSNNQTNEEKTASETKTDAETTNTPASTSNSSPFSPFDIQSPISQPQPQATQQLPSQQLIDDLFFDFTSISPPKNDNNNNNQNTVSNEVMAITIIDDNTKSESVTTTDDATNEEENIPVGTDESSMSISESEDVIHTSQTTLQPPTNQQNNEISKSSTEDQKESPPKGLEKKSSGTIGFYSDGVNSFTFNPDEELQKGPNPFAISQTPTSNQSQASSDSAKFNPFIQNVGSQSDQKFNPFGVPPPPSSTTTTTNDNKNATSTDVFKSSTTEITTNVPLKSNSSTSDTSFNPFGKPQPASQSDKTETKANENANNTNSTNNSAFSPFGQSQSTVSQNEKAEVKANKSDNNNNNASNSASSPFGPTQTEKTEAKQEESNNSSFNPFGQFQPAATEQKSPSENSNNDSPFNPFGQMGIPASNSTDDHSFTFTLRSNQIPDVDDSDFLPVNNAVPQQAAASNVSESAKADSQEEQKPFSPFGTFTPSPQQQEQSFTFTFSEPQAAATSSSDAASGSQQQPNEASQKLASSSESPFTVRRGSRSPTDPFTMLINSLTPYTEDDKTADDQIENQSSEQLHHETKQHENGSNDDNDSNPFAPWNPTDLDKALGDCKELEKIDSDALNRFDGKAPPPPSFVAFEKSPAALMLKDYCSQQLATTGSSLEHINELLGIQDTAKISIEDFAA
ncbi:hypothetical protein M9Y10_009599 [Tritrichomonas musculus]|uniref:Uncharacterized protein n=1 Tax=Tritrichomonas musculus TaxID=1915356 RepID=A0ABR2IQK9_9EUKA